MNETAKTRKLMTARDLTCLRGRGIDIGCGSEPILESAMCFDVESGDANEITRFVQEQLDYVYSSHCLEHMKDARCALTEWWKLVKPGGYLFLIVPDEDLYEQGFWPSLFNDTHLWTFTIHKAESWSPVSLNLRELLLELPGAKLIDISVQDHGYRRGLMCRGPASVTRWHRFQRRAMRTLWRVLRDLGLTKGVPRELAARFGRPIDQTVLPDVVAQIRAIVQKDSGPTS